MGDLVERLQNRIAWELCSFGPNRPDAIGANGGPNWRRYLPKAEQLVSETKARIEALEAREKVLVEALYGAHDALREHIAWEADLIMSEREWSDGIPCPTPALWDKLTDELQPKRNAATDKVRAALGSEQ